MIICLEFGDFHKDYFIGCGDGKTFLWEWRWAKNLLQFKC